MLFGREHWSPLVDWIKTTLLKSGTVGQNDIDLFCVTDEAEEAAARVIDFCREQDLLSS